MYFVLRWTNQRSVVTEIDVLLDFSFTVKAAPHECVIRTSQPKA